MQVSLAPAESGTTVTSDSGTIVDRITTPYLERVVEARLLMEEWAALPAGCMADNVVKDVDDGAGDRGAKAAAAETCITGGRGIYPASSLSHSTSALQHRFTALLVLFTGGEEIYGRGGAVVCSGGGGGGGWTVRVVLRWWS